MDSRAVVVSDDEDLLGSAVVTDALLALGSTTGLEIRPTCANYIKLHKIIFKMSQNWSNEVKSDYYYHPRWMISLTVFITTANFCVYLLAISADSRF